MKFDNSVMIKGVSARDCEYIFAANNQSCTFIDHAFVRDENGQLYLFAHGDDFSGCITVNDMPQDPMDTIQDFFFDGENKDPLHELENVKVVCCHSADMEWGETFFGVGVSTVLETPYPVKQWFYEREDGLFDIEVYEVCE